MATASAPRPKSRFSGRDIHGYIRVRDAIAPRLELPDEGHWQIVEEGTGRVLREVAEPHCAVAYANMWNRLKDPGEPLCYAVEVRVVRIRGGRVVRPTRSKGGAA